MKRSLSEQQAFWRKRVMAMVMAVVLVIGTTACAKNNGSGETSQGDSVLKPVVVDRGVTPEVMVPVNRAASLALQQYIYTRLKTEAFISADFKVMDPNELTAMVDEVVGLWETSQQLTGSVEQMTDKALVKLAAADFSKDPLASSTETLLVQLASEGDSKQMVPMVAQKGNDYGTLTTSGGDPQEWAEGLTAKYDAIKGAQTIKQLAAQLGTDAKSAYEQLTLAQEIIHNGAMSDAATLDKLMKVAQATKTVCKVGLFVTATVATGGGTLSALAASSVTVAQGGAIIIGGADCIVDIAATGSSILLGENNQVTVGFDDVKNKLAPVSAVVGLITFNPGETGEQLAYLGDTLADWFVDGKILGVKVKNSDKGIRIEGESVNIAQKSKEDIVSELKTMGFTVPDKEAAAETKGSISDAEIAKVAITHDEAMTILDTLLKELEEILKNAGEVAPTPAVSTGASGASVPVIFKNMSGAEWVLCMKSKTAESYITNDYRLDYDSFVVKPSGERVEEAKTFSETSNWIGEFKMLSENTFEGVIYLAAGEVPDYEVGDSSSVTYEQALLITGGDGIPLTLQWDGAQFSQVK